MRLVLLGVDDSTVTIAEAAAHTGLTQIVMIDPLARRVDEAMRLAPHANLLSEWEDVLSDSAVDAVLVGADDADRRVEQLRRLLQMRVPVMVSHPVTLSMLDAYELDMIHRESPGVLLPVVPARWHPAAAELVELVDGGEDGPIGVVEQVILERFLANRQREAVLQQFCQDAVLLQHFAGDATKLHALGPTTDASMAGAFGNLTVQMTSAEGRICRWTVAPVEQQPEGRLTLAGSRGKAVLRMPADNGTWQLEIRSAGNSTAKEYPRWEPAVAALEELSSALKGAEVEPTWPEAARTIELADTIDRSLARGRTIDLHHEEFTDVSTFKGTMASVGCGLLMAGLALVVLVAMAHTLAANAGWQRLADVLGHWPYLLLGVLGIFLVLQLFLLVGKPRDADSD